MASEHHQNPYISVISGVLGGLFAFMQSNDVLMGGALELLKVIIFGFIGGGCGYLGRLWVLRLHEYIKKRSKDICD